MSAKNGGIQTLPHPPDLAKISSKIRQKWGLSTPSPSPWSLTSYVNGLVIGGFKEKLFLKIGKRFLFFFNVFPHLISPIALSCLLNLFSIRHNCWPFAPIKNPVYGRHWISWRVQKVAPILKEEEMDRTKRR